MMISRVLISVFYYSAITYELDVIYSIDTPDFGSVWFKSSTILESSKNLKTYGFAAETMTSLAFDLKACSAAGIYMSNSIETDSTMPLYNIHFDGNQKKWSAIRSRNVNFTATNTITDEKYYYQGGPSLLSCNISRPLWISWDRGVIAFGTGNITGSNLVFSWTDSFPFPVQSLYIYTIWGETGEWQIPVDVSYNYTGRYRKCKTSHTRADLNIMDVLTTRRIVCSAICGRHDDCIGFNYHLTQQRCELLAVEGVLQDIQLLTDAGWTFYAKCYSNGEVCVGCLF